MGELKVQLAAEAKADRLLDEQHGHEQSSSMLDAVFGLFVGAAHAQDLHGREEAWQDEVTLTLEPGATAEIKMAMEAGNVAEYAWIETGGPDLLGQSFTSFVKDNTHDPDLSTSIENTFRAALVRWVVDFYYSQPHVGL